MKVKIEPTVHATSDVRDRHDGTYLVVFRPRASLTYKITIACYEDGIRTAHEYDVEVERADRWTVKGLVKSQNYSLHTPIPFSIAENSTNDLDQSMVVATDFYVEVRNPMNHTQKLLPLSCTTYPLEFFMEFTPEYNGVHKLTLFYKSVLIGDHHCKSRTKKTWWLW